MNDQWKERFKALCLVAVGSILTLIAVSLLKGPPPTQNTASRPLDLPPVEGPVKDKGVVPQGPIETKALEESPKPEGPTPEELEAEALREASKLWNARYAAANDALGKNRIRNIEGLIARELIQDIGAVLTGKDDPRAENARRAIDEHLPMINAAAEAFGKDAEDFARAELEAGRGSNEPTGLVDRTGGQPPPWMSISTDKGSIFLRRGHSPEYDRIVERLDKERAEIRRSLEIALRRAINP